MATTIQPLDYRSSFAIALTLFAKRAALGGAVALCALAFVVMAATAADQDLKPQTAPIALDLTKA
jgi:hypothetical protein